MVVVVFNTEANHLVTDAFSSQRPTETWTTAITFTSSATKGSTSGLRRTETTSGTAGPRSVGSVVILRIRSSEVVCFFFTPSRHPPLMRRRLCAGVGSSLAEETARGEGEGGRGAAAAGRREGGEQQV